MRCPGGIVVSVVVVLAGWSAPVAADVGVYERVSAGSARVVAGGAQAERGTVRLALGARRGRLAVEGWLTAVGDEWAFIDCYGAECDVPARPGLGAGGVTVRYLEPLTAHLGLHVHGDLGYAGGWGALDGWGGPGAGAGGGLHAAGRVPLLGLLVPYLWLWRRDLPGPRVTVGAHVEASVHRYDLHRTAAPPPARRERDEVRTVAVHELTLGVSFGVDF